MLRLKQCKKTEFQNFGVIGFCQMTAVMSSQWILGMAGKNGLPHYTFCKNFQFGVVALKLSRRALSHFSCVVFAMRLIWHISTLCICVTWLMVSLK